MSQVQEILAVCNVIGKSSNFRFIYPEDGKKEDTKEEVLSQIQHASKVPIRKVALQKKWWKKSSTPLLIFHEKSQKAVALIPTSSGRYHIVNPLDGSKKNLREEEALSFEKPVKSVHINSCDCELGDRGTIFSLKPPEYYTAPLARAGI